MITKRGYYYETNADALGPNGATVAIFKLSSGHLTFKGTTPQIHETLKTDEALSTDQKYLYVLAPTSNRAGRAEATSTSTRSSPTAD